MLKFFRRKLFLIEERLKIQTSECGGVPAKEKQTRKKGSSETFRLRTPFGTCLLSCATVHGTLRSFPRCAVIYSNRRLIC